MSTESLKTIFEDIHGLVKAGKIMDIFEKYYAEDVVMQENDNPPTVGKEANRQRELDFFSKVTEFRALELKSVAFGDDVIMAEWFGDYTHAEWGVQTKVQVSVSKWRDGQIISEKFYYGS